MCSGILQLNSWKFKYVQMCMSDKFVIRVVLPPPKFRHVVLEMFVVLV
jgi:hypothetical protein